MGFWSTGVEAAKSAMEDALAAAGIDFATTTLVSPDSELEADSDGNYEDVEAIFYMKETDYIDDDGYFISPVFIASTDFEYEDNLEAGQIGIQYVKFYDDTSGETLNLFSATRTLDYQESTLTK